MVKNGPLLFRSGMISGLTVASLRLPENARLILDIFFLAISA